MKQLLLAAIVATLVCAGALRSIADDGPAGGSDSGLWSLEPAAALP